MSALAVEGSEVKEDKAVPQSAWANLPASKTDRPRVVIADDHSLVAEGLARLVSEEFEVVAVAQNGIDLVRAVEELSPDIALLDISMPGMPGIEAARHIQENNSRCKVIFVSMHSKPEFVREAFRTGALGYVLKSSAGVELVEAMREALKGSIYISPPLAKEFLSILLRPKPISLTSRQREVLNLVAQGKSAKEMASALNVSVKTVQFHKGSIMEKLGLRSTAELTRYALEHGITS